jgi:hypothetical protein
MSLVNDYARADHAVRQLSWATYMVDVDGKNKYMQDENWLTDGYGDYVRHYLRSMAFMPEIAPANQDHLLFSSSVVQHVFYEGQLDKYYYPNLTDYAKIQLHYQVYDADGSEVIRLAKKPSGVLFDNKEGMEGQLDQGYQWKPLDNGGVLTIKRKNVKRVTVLR